MKSNIKDMLIILLFIAVMSFLVLNLPDKQKQIEEEVGNIISSETTFDRVGSAVITIPGEEVLVELNNGTKDYKSNIGNGTISLLPKYLKTHIFYSSDKNIQPRLDVFVPMIITNDKKGNSFYVALFEDRGDDAILRSHVRLGGDNVVMGGIEILPKSNSIKDEEYRILITYSLGKNKNVNTSEIISRKIIIPIIDSRFNSENTIIK